jgi:DNA-binding NtrC family response regulator
MVDLVIETQHSTDEQRDDGGEAPGPREGLIVLATPDRALPAAIWLGEELVLGREEQPGPHLVIDDTRLSRRHARVLRRARPGRWVIEDLASRNGTFVEGRRIGARVELALGSVVRIGETLFELGEEAPPAPPGAPVGAAPAFVRAVELAERVAPSDLTVLLRGETGTGKELFARHLHQRARPGGPFVAVNCGAMPRDLVEAQLFGHRRGAFTGATQDSDGLFKRADGGTLFLDEVGELAPDAQVALLRVLETREVSPVGGGAPLRVDVRVVAATNADLEGKLERGELRRDLYARLAGFVIELPPLRARRRDVLPLARRFLAEAAPGRTITFTAAAAEALVLHGYPMNVRELRLAMRRLALLVDGDARVERARLDDALPREPPAGDDAPRAAPDRAELEALLRAHHGQVARVAAHYGKSVRQVYRWLERHRLRGDDHR